MLTLAGMRSAGIARLGWTGAGAWLRLEGSGSRASCWASWGAFPDTSARALSELSAAMEGAAEAASL
jgi:hypothetical protein